MAKPNVLDHLLVPKHEIINEEEADEILKIYNIEIGQLPKIKEKDPAVLAVGAKVNDIIKITRASPTAGTAIIYRLVIE